LRWPALSARARLILTAVLIVITACAITATSAAFALTANSAPLDFGTFGAPGADLLRGQWGSVFADPTIQAGPFELAFWGVAELLGVAGPLGWTVFCAVSVSLFAFAFAFVVERALRGIVGRWSVVLASAAAAVFAISSAPISAVANGHPAQLAIPLLWLGAGMLARADRPFTAGAVLALTAGWELWGLLGVAVLLLAPRIDVRTAWRSALGVAAVLVLMFAPFALLGPFRMFGFAWPIYEGTLAHLLLPEAATFPWPLRLAQGALSIGAGATVALVLRRSPDAIWLVPLAACSVRLLIDPVSAGYYTDAPILLVLVGLALSLARLSLLLLLACLAALNVLIDFQRFTVIPAIALVVLVVLTVALAARAAGCKPSSPRPGSPATPLLVEPK
jgi:hypothetical protein